MSSACGILRLKGVRCDGLRGSIAVAAPPVPVGTLAAATSQARSSPPAPAPTAAASPSFLSAARDYDPIPDLIRMQGVVGGPNPAPYDPLVVIVRRGGGVEFMDAARSFRSAVHATACPSRSLSWLPARDSQESMSVSSLAGRLLRSLVR